MVQKGYASIKMFSNFSLHVSVLVEESNTISILFVDYIIIYYKCMEVFISVHENGRFKINVKCFNKNVRKKIVEGIGERVTVSNKEELEIFLSHFEIFVKLYLEKIVRDYSEKLPDECNQLIFQILSQI
jgi:hypothetical protein